jgi:hypothetical protein
MMMIMMMMIIIIIIHLNWTELLSSERRLLWNDILYILSSGSLCLPLLYFNLFLSTNHHQFVLFLVQYHVLGDIEINHLRSGVTSIYPADFTVCNSFRIPNDLVSIILWSSAYKFIIYVSPGRNSSVMSPNLPTFNYRRFIWSCSPCHNRWLSLVSCPDRYTVSCVPLSWRKLR